MKQEYELLHNDMLYDIERCLKLQHPLTENAERCFWIAKKYWEKLKERVHQKGFKDASQEIEFFREVKPQFTLYIEFYVILAEALQFEPVFFPMPNEVADCLSRELWEVATRKSIVDYWENESKRFKRFCDKHSEFIEYYENGKRDNDRVYFLRENDIARDIVPTSLFDMDKTYTTSYERLLRSYFANKKYWEYCKERFVASRSLLRRG